MKINFAFLIGMLAMTGAPTASALTLTVGSPGCNYTSLQSAINALAANPDSSHTIKLKSGTIAIPNGVVMNIPASDIFLTGGFANCIDAAPTTGQRTTLDATGGSNGTAMSIDAGNRSLQQWIRFDSVTVRGGNSETGPLENPEGGGLELRGHARVYLDNVSRIDGNVSGKGGGVFLNGASSTRRAELLIRDRSAVAGNGAATLGGGIYCENHGTVELIEGKISFNSANDGGGLYLKQGCRLASAAAGSSGIRSIETNEAVRVGSTGGYGGGMYILPDSGNSNPVSLLGDSGNPILVFNNSAYFGGGILARNTTSTRQSLQFSNTIWADNSATYGGGLRLEGGFDVSIHATPGCSYSYLGTGRIGCSAFDNNDSSQGPGALETTIAPGSSLLPKLTITRTRFDNNVGAPALIGYYSESIVVEGAIIRNNRSLASGDQWLSRTLFSLFRQQSIRYTTILANDTDYIVSSQGSAVGDDSLSLLGSIIWAPGTQAWRDLRDPPTPFEYGDCLLAHANSGLPANVAVGDPQLDSTLTPGPTSPALDICDTVFGTPQADYYGQARGYDQPAIPNYYGPYDLGAVERRTPTNDTIFKNGFDTP